MSKDRLLTDEEFDEAGTCGRNFYPILQAQDAKTASILTEQHQEELRNAVQQVHEQCHERVKGIFEFLDKYHTDAPFHNFTLYMTENEWQALKKQEGVE